MNGKKQRPDREYTSLYRDIVSISSEEECRNFFQDLLAASERQALEQRYEVARMLLARETYQDIQQETNASTVTISRVRRALEETGAMRAVICRGQKGQREDTDTL